MSCGCKNQYDKAKIISEDDDFISENNESLLTIWFSKTINFILQLFVWTIVSFIMLICLVPFILFVAICNIIGKPVDINVSKLKEYSLKFK